MDKVPKIGLNKGLLVVVLVFLVALIAIKYGNVFSPSSGEKVRALYEVANPGTKFEVMSMTPESGMYKVLLRYTNSAGTNYKEIYVSKDGKLLSESMIFVDKSTEQMTKMRNFVDCMSGRGLRIYGVLNQSFSPGGAAATSMQLQLLGLYAGKIYVSCDGPALQTCVGIGIQQVPSVVYNSTIYSGARDIAGLEDISGCKL